MGNKNVLIVSEYFYPENISTGILPYELAQEIAENGYNAKVLTGFPNEYLKSTSEYLVKKAEILNGIEIRRIKYPRFNKQKKIGRIFNYLSFCFAILLNISKFKRIDLCLVYTNPPLLPFIVALIKKIHKYKMFLVMYDVYPDAAIKSGVIREKSFLAKVFASANKYAMNTAEKIIALSNECKKYLVVNKNISPSNIVVIPNWYSKQKICRNYHSTLNIVYGGNMGIMQDMDSIKQIVFAFRKNENVRFLFCGHGNKKEDFDNFIRSNNIRNCELIGYIEKSKYDNLLDKADLAFVSLEKFAHGLGSPSKAYSYLSKGIPLIVVMNKEADIYKDVKDFDCGVLADDLNDAINGINGILSKEIDLNILKKNAVSLFNKKYEKKLVCKEYIKQIDETLEVSR